MSDEMAYGAMHTLAAAGLRAGGDRAAGEIAIVGFDGHDLAEIFDLTTVAQPVRELGRQAGDLLMRHVQAGAQQMAQSLVLATHLQVRGSTMVPPTDVTSALPD
jgi:DNA-binding LacI/PurR family transcriptional regulator